MKKLGIIGGLGPMATAYLMEQIIRMTDAKCDQDHIEMIVHNDPTVPDRTSYILDHSKPNPLPKMKDMAIGLEEAGCQVLAMPCITAHFFHNDLEQALHVNLIHGIRECGLYLKDRGIKCAGVMATDGTVTSKLFTDIFKEFDINVVYPDTKHQKYVMSIIYDDVKAGGAIDISKFELASDNLKNMGAEVIILGCTELSIVKRDLAIGSGYLDVIDIIAKTAVESCGKLKSEYKELIT